MFYPFVFSALLPSESADAQMLFDEAAKEAMEECFYHGELVYIHAVYELAPQLRGYAQFGFGPRGEPFWVMERTDGPRVLALYPLERANDCFTHFLDFLQSFHAGVNSSPFSMSCCFISPDESAIAARVRELLASKKGEI